MRRRLFTLGAALSQLLFLAATWLWVRSYTSEVVFVDSRPGQLLLIGLDAPRARVDAARGSYTGEDFLGLLLKPPVAPGMRPIPPATEHHLLGFWLVRGDRDASRTRPRPEGMTASIARSGSSACPTGSPRR